MSLLYPHQQALVKKGEVILRNKGLVALICEPRVGKTLVSIALAVCHGESYLVLTKKAAIADWSKSMQFCGFGGNVVNYEQAHKIDPNDYDTVILDESHSRLSAYPKPTRTWEAVRLLTADKQIIYLTATPSVESMSQWFWQIQLSDRSPWNRYGRGKRAFYGWFKDGYGKPDQMRIGTGQMINSYKKTHDDKINADIAPYLVKMTQQEADPDWIQSEVIEHRISNPGLVSYCKQFEKDRVANLDGLDIVADTPVSLLQKLHQLAGGTVRGETPEGETRATYVSGYKIDYIRDNFGKRTAILCHYVAERDMLLDRLDSATDNLEKFKSGEFDYFVGSIMTYCEGVDLSFASQMVLYSLSWSGRAYIQVRERMCQKARRSAAKVHVLIGQTTVDEKVYKAVSRKKDFCTSFYRRDK